MKQYIKSLGLDWLFRYYIKDQENLIKFFNTFYELETDDNLLSFVKEFRKLLEFNWELRPFESISQESSDYFTALDQFARENPLKALKLVILLCCHEENFYDNHVFITKLKSTAQGFFFLDSIPLLVRLKFCILCVHNWPIDDPMEYRSGCFFSGILSVLFIQYATENVCFLF